MTRAIFNVEYRYLVLAGIREKNGKSAEYTERIRLTDDTTDDTIVLKKKEFMKEFRHPGEKLWFCNTCGYHPANTSHWCGAGCGGDYNEIVNLEQIIEKHRVKEVK